MEHFAALAARHRPIVAHAEGRTLAAVILMAALYDRPVHLAHVSLREEILLIRAAKEQGLEGHLRGGPAPPVPHRGGYPRAWAAGAAKCARAWRPRPTGRRCGTTWR